MPFLKLERSDVSAATTKANAEILDVPYITLLFMHVFCDKPMQRDPELFYLVITGQTVIQSKLLLILNTIKINRAIM